MNRYSDYKETNIDWIGQIPCCWKLGKLYQYSRLTNGSTPSRTVDEYWDNGTIPWMSSGEVNKKIIKEIDAKISKLGFDNSSVEILPIGTVMLALNGQGKTKGTVGILEIETTCNQSLCGIVPKNMLFSKYLYYYLESQYKSLRGLVGEGQREGISVSFLSRYPVLLPPLLEQKQISQCLDKKLSQIDSLIEKTERKIELLKEQQTATINHYVTKGLVPTVKMKDSGIEWIGEIPEHWEVTRLKFHGEVIIGLSFDTEDIVDENEGTLVLRSSNVQNGKISFTENLWVKTEVPEKLQVKVGDILICSRNGSRNLIGKNCLLGNESLGMTWGVFMTVFRTKYFNFFYWILNSQVFKSQSGLYLTSTINQLTVSTLENLVFPFTSDITEQNKISNFLSEKTDKFNEILIKESKRIELLKEYRQSLISNVVTGKVRVTEEVI